MQPTAADEARLGRLRIRCWRRGTREMDLILGPFADAALPGLAPVDLDALEALLAEDDPAAYLWLTGQQSAPPEHAAIVALIRAQRGIA